MMKLAPACLLFLCTACGSFLQTRPPVPVDSAGLEGSVEGKIAEYNRIRQTCGEARREAARPHNRAAATRLSLTMSASVFSAVAGGTGIGAFAENNRAAAITAVTAGAIGALLGIVAASLEPSLKQAETNAKVIYDPKDRALEFSELEPDTLGQLQSRENANYEAGRAELQKLVDIARICNTPRSEPPAPSEGPPEGPVDVETPRTSEEPDEALDTPLPPGTGDTNKTDDVQADDDKPAADPPPPLMVFD